MIYKLGESAQFAHKHGTEVDSQDSENFKFNVQQGTFLKFGPVQSLHKHTKEFECQPDSSESDHKFKD